ncbi:HD domain-containing protein [Peptostreptococcus faecalis]|uniref:HD domain-containing protein n=1 Tax=Peptostreptococcus faecalis TaxID=2045015 RepID=UPI000C7B2D8F|nr:HD domain-containing protein [Peptostreptococcus faecalis]
MERVNAIIAHPDFLEAMSEIKKLEKKRIFCGHDLEHLLSVARIMYLTVLNEKIDIDKEIIYSTALLHDLGRAIQYKSGSAHAIESVKIAKKILEDVGFDRETIDYISTAIKEHNTETTTELSRILKYADKQSRNCFMCDAIKECKWSDEKKNMGVVL